MAIRHQSRKRKRPIIREGLSDRTAEFSKVVKGLPVAVARPMIPL
jgi:hypothetical protein